MYEMSFSWGPSQCYTPEEAMERVRMYELRMCPSHLRAFSLYLEALQSSGQAQCTTVWVKGTVAYRCRTCQVNDASAICKGCFMKGDHKQHDYVMYHSESGGCCDCGDPEAWQEIGFCSAHRSVDRQEHSVPAELEGPTKNSVNDVLGMLSFIIGYIPETTKGGPPVSQKKKIETAMIFLAWLQKLCSVDALRKIVCTEIVQKTVNDRETRELKAPLQILLKMFSSMSEEIMEGETTLFLQMLYNPVFKQQYAEELMDNYQAMIESVVDRNIRDTPYDPLIKHFKSLDSSLERVMVQIFNVKNMELIRSKNLLRLFVMSFGKVLRRCVRSGTNVVNVRDPKIVYKMYLRPQGDLRLIVAHPDVAQLLVEEHPDVFTSILDVLVYLQWMNPYWSTRDIDFEVQNDWTLAIQLEMNTMAILFQIISRCHEIYKPELEGSIEISGNSLLTTASLTLTRLHSYLNEGSMLDFLNDTSSNSPMSLHIPLHRTLSAILAKLVLLPWKDANNGFLSSLKFGFSEKEVLALMEHPLRIMVWMAQIRAGGWLRASEDFSRLELIYRGSFWHDQSMDMDILLLQFCAVARENMERAMFMRMAERFELKELVSSPQFKHESLVKDKMSLLQDFIRLVLLVVRERRNTGMEEEDCLRYDVIQWLCVKNQTYSQLCRALSAIPVDHEKLTAMLEKVAHFHLPKVQERGYYELKAECWHEFDPLFAHFYINELEDAQERAVSVGKLPHYWRINHSGVVKQPYNRLVNLLHTEECHILLWNVLNHVNALVVKDCTATACEALGVIALQMMALTLQDRRENKERFPASSMVLQSPHVPSNDIYYNVLRRPQLNENTRVMEWGIHQSEFPCILDLLRRLQDVTSAPRLVDSVQHVLLLLKESPYPEASEASTANVELVVSPKLHARVHATEDDERLQKKQRQEAIMAQFRAKQNAFLEQFVDSDNDESDTTSIIDSKLGTQNGNEDPSSEVSSVVAKSEKAVVEQNDAQECAFCRSECGCNDKSTGWIAFVQRYNMPKLVINKREEVDNKDSAESIVRTASMANGTEDAKQLVVYTGENMIDNIPTEHVRCCGHQMHEECFQSYHSSLLNSHNKDALYEGKGIVQIDKIEFLCPICRRLANALLPVVHQASLSRTLQACVKEDLEDQGKHWVKYWEMRKSLSSAMDQFAIQSLNVRSNFGRQEQVKELPRVPVLWEVFASNITHCEVETREELQEVSTTSHQSSNQRVWGGESGHWIAIQELAKLAMVSTTLVTGTEMATKRDKMKSISAGISKFLQNRELKNEYLRNVFASVHDVLLRLQKSVEETCQLEVVKNNKGKEEETYQTHGVVKASSQKSFPSAHLPPFSSYRDFEAQEQQVYNPSEARWDLSEPPMPELFQARGMPDRMRPGINHEAQEQQVWDPSEARWDLSEPPMPELFQARGMPDRMRPGINHEAQEQQVWDPSEARWDLSEPPMPELFQARGMPDRMRPGINHEAQEQQVWDPSEARWDLSEPPMPELFQARGMPDRMRPGINHEAQEQQVWDPSEARWDLSEPPMPELFQARGMPDRMPLGTFHEVQEQRVRRPHRSEALWDLSEPPMPELFQARGMPPGMIPGTLHDDPVMLSPWIDMEMESKDFGSTLEETSCWEPEDFGPSEPVLTEIEMDWSSTLQDCSLFNTDPFRLLIVLLSAFPGWPKVEEIFLLVKFSYMVALTQVLLACSRMQNNVDIDVTNLERDWGDVVRYALLPFLRRAALLVQSITGEGCKQKYTGSGRKVMDALYLQQELGLEDSYRSLISSSGADNAEHSSLNSLLQSLQADDKDAKLTLMKVPRELHFAFLPRVYQELLLRSIMEECEECKTLPTEPAICLVCGTFFCCGSAGSLKDNAYECSRHAESEGSGIGVFLLMHSTQLVLIRGDRVCMAPSLYLDQHGEGACGERQDETDSDESDEPEDTFLRRSQLLHLSNLRLNEVRRMWVTAAFDYDTHILHNSRISPGSL